MDRLCALTLDFMRDRRGATALEYGFIAFLVSIAAVATLYEIGPALSAKYAGVMPALK